MNGMDPGAVAQAFLAYFSGPGGGYIAGAAILLTYLLTAAHVMHPKAGWMTTVAVVGAWVSAWTMRLIGWV